MKGMRFRDIPQFTRHASYTVDVGFDYLPRHLARYIAEYNLDMSPDFQRGHVWTMEQKTRFVEYVLRGGKSGLDIYINCSWWNRSVFKDGPKDTVLVDGKQRLDAVLGFLNNEVPVFGGHYRREFEDRFDLSARFKWHVNDLQTREEVLQWYLDLNSGGTIHTEAELEKVRKFIADQVPYTAPSQEELLANARADRDVLKAALDEIEAEKKALRERNDNPPPAPKAKKGAKKNR